LVSPAIHLTPAARHSKSFLHRLAYTLRDSSALSHTLPPTNWGKKSLIPSAYILILLDGTVSG